MIHPVLKKIKDRMKERNIKGSLMYVAISGSKLYGLNTPSSDSDYKAIYVPALESVVKREVVDVIEICSNKDVKNTSEDSDIVVYSIQKFLDLLKQGDAGAIDILFSMHTEPSKELVLLNSFESTKYLKENFSQLISKKVESYVGFAMKQANKYSVKGSRLLILERVLGFLKGRQNDVLTKDIVNELLAWDNEFIELVEKAGFTYISILNRKFVLNMKVSEVYSKLISIKNLYGDRTKIAADVNGIDFKAFSHAFRAVYEAQELMETGYIVLPLREPVRQFVMNVKMGVHTDLQELSDKLDEEVNKLALLKENSKLPDRVDDAFIKEILWSIYSDNKEIYYED